MLNNCISNWNRLLSKTFSELPAFIREPSTSEATKLHTASREVS